MENKKITIGRDKKCDLVIEDIAQNYKVSGFHATIKEIDVDDVKRFIIEDHSTNGTYVNSKLIHNDTYKIQEGDTITLGRDYLLEWDSILPFFVGRKTKKRPIDQEPEMTPKKGPNSHIGYISADPVYPDPLPIDSEPDKPIINDVPSAIDEKKFVFNGLHLLITIGATIIGFALGVLVNSKITQ